MLPSGCVYVLISEQIQNQEVPPQLPSIQGTEPQRVNSRSSSKNKSKLTSNTPQNGPC